MTFATRVMSIRSEPMPMIMRQCLEAYCFRQFLDHLFQRRIDLIAIRPQLPGETTELIEHCLGLLLFAASNYSEADASVGRVGK